MKFTAERENLLAALQAAIGVVERRQTMPILANVLLAAKENRLAVTATDLEVELVAHAEVKSSVDGAVTIPGRKLLDICRSLPEKATITVAQEGERVAGGLGELKAVLQIPRRRAGDPYAEVVADDHHFRCEKKLTVEEDRETFGGQLGRDDGFPGFRTLTS